MNHSIAVQCCQTGQAHPAREQNCAAIVGLKLLHQSLLGLGFRA